MSSRANCKLNFTPHGNTISALPTLSQNQPVFFHLFQHSGQTQRRDACPCHASQPQIYPFPPEHTPIVDEINLHHTQSVIVRLI